MDFPIGPGSGQTVLFNTTTIAAHATPLTKSNYTEMIASTAHHYTSLIVSGLGLTGVNFLVDIAVGAAASEQVILPNLIIPGSAGTYTCIQVPIEIPVGSRVAVRVSATTGASACYISVSGVTGNMWGSPPGGYIQDLATVLASGRGAGLDAGAVANTYPATWTQVIASTTAQVSAISAIVGANNNSATVGALWRLQIGVGAASSEQVIAELAFGSSTIHINSTPSFWLPADIPTGSRIAARVRSSTVDATDRVCQLGLYGLVS